MKYKILALLCVFVTLGMSFTNRVLAVDLSATSPYLTYDLSTSSAIPRVVNIATISDRMNTALQKKLTDCQYYLSVVYKNTQYAGVNLNVQGQGFDVLDSRYIPFFTDRAPFNGSTGFFGRVMFYDTVNAVVINDCTGIVGIRYYGKASFNNADYVDASWASSYVKTVSPTQLVEFSLATSLLAVQSDGSFGLYVDGNLPIFRSADLAVSFFQTGNTALCLNYDAVSSSLPEIYSSDMPTIDNLRWKVDADAWRTNPYTTSTRSQYNDYGNLVWDLNNPNGYEIAYDVEACVNGIYNTFTEGTEVGSNSSKFHTNWIDIYNSAQKNTAYNYLDADSRRYCTSISHVETATMPYMDESNNSLIGVNLQGCRYSDVLFRVRAKKFLNGSYVCGNWAVVSYNLQDNTFTAYDTGNSDSLSSSTVTGGGSYDSAGNQWVDKTNSDYAYDSSSGLLNSDNLISSIKNGFGLFGSNGLVKFMGDIFSFLPKEFFVILLTGLSIMVLTAVLKFLRG